MRILSGVQSSGRLHLGNYFGAIRQWVRYQDLGEALYFVADLHSLTTIRDGALRREYTRDAAVACLAFGIDPARSILFVQSDIPEIPELNWILGTVVPLSNLERAHSYKDKIARGLAPEFGLFAYPVLMAADILLYGSDLVPVGRDQVQHVEFARDWATKFNLLYVRGYDPADPTGADGHPPGIFKIPEAKVEEATAVVPGLDGQKMSKSYGNAIDLFAPDSEVKKKIMSIKTDSTPVDAPKPTQNAPLYQLLQLLVPAAEWPAVETSWKAGGKGYGDYKKLLLECFHGEFDAARKVRDELLAAPGDVDQILRDGAARARAVAAPVLKMAREAAGLSNLG